jgi:hypothetical protein
VQVGDGKVPLFKWITNGPLCFQFSAPFSHANRLNISVADCWRDGERIIPLKHITSSEAESEREALFEFLSTCALHSSKVDRRGWTMNKCETFSVKNLYKIMKWGGVEYETIWKCVGLKKWKIFAWQLIKGRIKVRSVLFR